MTVSIVGTPTVKVAFATALPAFTIPATAVGSDLVLIPTGSTFFAPMAVSPAMTQIGPVTSGSGSSTHANMSLFWATVASLGGAGASVTVSDGATSNNLAAGLICLHTNIAGATLALAPSGSGMFANSAGATATGGTAPSLGAAIAAGLVVFFSHVVASSAITYTAPSGFTQQAQGARAFASVDLCTKTVASGASVAAATDSSTGSGEWVAGQVLVYEMSSAEPARLLTAGQSVMRAATW